MRVKQAGILSHNSQTLETTTQLTEVHQEKHIQSINEYKQELEINSLPEFLNTLSDQERKKLSDNQGVVPLQTITKFCNKTFGPSTPSYKRILKIVMGKYIQQK